MSISGTSVAGSESDCRWGRRLLTEGGSVEAAPGAMERARSRQVGGGEREVADGVVGEKAVEPVAGEGEAYQVVAAQVLGYLRPNVRLIPASANSWHSEPEIQGQIWV
jgi:hypothetical protein